MILDYVYIKNILFMYLFSNTQTVENFFIWFIFYILFSLLPSCIKKLVGEKILR